MGTPKDILRNNQIVQMTYSLVTNRDIRSFLLIFGSLILSWEVFFHYVWNNQILLNAYNNFSIEVIHVILYCCQIGFELFGITTEVNLEERILRLPNTIGVTVGEPCIGYEVSALFSGLIISLKGSSIKKLWFIPFGIISIFLLNLLRISALALLVNINQTIWELNHKLIFSLIIYTFIFTLWRYWIKNETLKQNK
jgi:exosortase/archaeosortase family protein